MPNFSESLLATLERFQVLEETEEVFLNIVDGIIVGGSLAYGPFYNVRAGEDKTVSSDIDMIMIIGDDFLDEKAWSAFENYKIFSETEKASFKKRRDVFLNLKERR